MMAAFTFDELIRILRPFMSAGTWIGRFALITRKPLSQNARPTMPCGSSFFMRLIAAFDLYARCTASMSGNRYGRSNTSNSGMPAGPNLPGTGASICTEPIFSASSSSASLNSMLFGYTSTLTRPFVRSSARRLNSFAACPFGVSGAATWLNLMTIGCCAAAGPATRSTARAAQISGFIMIGFPFVDVALRIAMQSMLGQHGSLCAEASEHSVDHDARLAEVVRGIAQLRELCTAQVLRDFAVLREQVKQRTALPDGLAADVVNEVVRV